MDIFKFNNPTVPTRMEQGEILNGFKSKMWIERYQKEGEFTLVAPAHSGMKDKLPAGTFISHVNSTEIMIVENHEINVQKGSVPEVTITGRGFETFFESRVVGSNKVFPVSGVMSDYLLTADYTWNQLVALISDHILAANLVDDDDAIPYASVLSQVAGVGISVERVLKRSDLYGRVLELLSVDNLGIRIIRPGLWSPLGATSPNLAIVIHEGVDRTTQVIFSNETDEIENADYLWSNKKLRNAALVTGKWVETRVVPAAVGYDRRWMYVNASDIDQDDQVAPTGARLTAVVAAMQQRGAEALAAQNEVALAKAEVSKEAMKSVYRTDFDVGDLIMVRGDYNETSAMRISEYVEIEDENGESGYPTLDLV